MNEKNATVDAALALHGYESEKQESDKVRPSFPQGPLIPPACRPLLERDAREAALADLAPDLPGQRYDEARDTDLPEFVVLHLGCGRKQRLEQLPPITCFTAAGDEVRPPIRLVNLDGMAHAGAHLTATLGADAIALPDDSVDLMIASHVLEHIGRQGELAGWFQFWGEVYRVLKSGGRLQFLSPYYTSQWCWGDPTHSRAIGEFCFLYLNQDSYRIPAEQTAIPDYRPPCDLQLLRWRLVADTDTQTRQREGRSHIEGVLVARKPFRPYWEDAR